MDWWKALDTAMPDLIVAGFAGVVAVTVGAALTHLWGMYQRQREIDLQTVIDFHHHYGQFFAVWKQWNRAVEKGDTNAASDLFERAAVAEGGIEAILSRVASQRRLNATMVVQLACFRQAFQSLRQAIKKGAILDWGSSKNAEYVRFKELTGAVSRIIHRRGAVYPFCAVESGVAWLKITSNAWEGIWYDKDLCQKFPAKDA